jgi:uncharacterized protein YegL
MKSFIQKTFQLFASITIILVMFFACGALLARSTETTKTAHADECPTGLDIMLVVDRSNSMTFDHFEEFDGDGNAINPWPLAQPLSNVQNGTISFIDTLNSSTDHVGLVEFDSTAVTSVPLTNVFSEVKTKVNADWVGGYTDIGAAIDKAHQELDSHGRSDARKVLVIVTDGYPQLTGYTDDAMRDKAYVSAQDAKDDGILIYSIGFGSAKEEILKHISSAPSSKYYRLAPSSSVLGDIYNELDLSIVCENEKPVISLDPSSGSLSIFVGDAFSTSTHATAYDHEDHDITFKITATSTVNTTLAGNYTVVYNVEDSQHKAADSKTLYVNVASTSPVENQKPVITLLYNTLSIFVNSAFEPRDHATAYDPEEHDITNRMTASSTVQIHTPGIYHVVYNVEDSQHKAADAQTLTVNVLSATSTNERPVITLSPVSGSLSIFVGDAFSTSTHATAYDPEEYDITNRIVATSTVNTSVAGHYTVIYGVKDSLQLSAVEKVLNVAVETRPVTPPTPSGCTSNCGGGGGSYYPQPALAITNEKVEYLGDGKAVVTWTTNLGASSVVSYGTSSIVTLGAPIQYGYPLRTTEDVIRKTEHSVTISGLQDGVQYWFRPVSRDFIAGIAVGKEVTYTVVKTPVVEPVVCNYLLEYIKLGANNNKVEVEKLERFLNTYQDEKLEVNGIYDQADYDAVARFQKKYSGEVLTPWGYDQSTGYVYITTKKKVNEIYCAKPFPLDTAQEAEIVAFKALLKQLAEQAAAAPVVHVDTVNPIVENEATTSTTTIDYNNLVGLLDDAKGTNAEAPKNGNLAAAFMGSVTDVLTSYWYIFVVIILVGIATVLYVRTRKGTQG